MPLEKTAGAHKWRLCPNADHSRFVLAETAHELRNFRSVRRFATWEKSTRQQKIKGRIDREGVVRRGKWPLGVPSKEIAMSHDSPFIIRQLGTGDIEVFRRLLDTFGEVFEDVDAYSRAQPRDAYLEGLLCSDNFIALAALQDGAVIGGLAAYELKKFERERKEMYIYDLAVAVQQRRRGIATGLITQLKTIAKARGAYVMFVQADLNDPAAIALYTKLGTREDVLHFDIAVP